MTKSAETEVFRSRHAIEPLIRFTLLALYLALVLPLPCMAPAGLKPLMLLALPLGLLVVLAISSEQVELDASGIRMGHPAWCSWLLRRGWSLPWPAIQGLTPVGTSQGGTVYYLRDTNGAAFLLPQRVERFPEFLQILGQQTNLNLASVGRISPPWTYRFLAVLCGCMLAVELAAAATHLSKV